MELAVASLSVLLDYIFSEPRRFHPLKFFGVCATAVEKRLNRPSQKNPWRMAAGAVAVLILVVPAGIICQVMRPQDLVWAFLFDVLLVYWALGARSLELHVGAVLSQIRKRHLPGTRAAVARIVSRDVENMDEQQAVNASLESFLENGSDAVFAPLLWYVLGGSSAVLVYRLVNTLDAMWGYKNQRFYAFGWFAARFDDVLNWLPARLTLLTYCILAKQPIRFSEMYFQAHAWESPNAGRVLASGAWALGVQLGGGAQYHGEWKQRPFLGMNRPATTKDIDAATGLLRQGLLLWFVVWLLGNQCV